MEKTNDTTFLDVFYETGSEHNYEFFKQMRDEAEKCGVENATAHILRNYVFDDSAFWEEFSEHEEVSEEVLEEFKEKLDWDSLCCYKKNVDDAFVEKWEEWVDWGGLSYNENITLDFIMKHINLLEFDPIVTWHDMPEEFIWENRYRIDWYEYCSHHTIDMKFVKRFIDFVDLNAIVFQSPLIADEVMIKYGDKIKWKELVDTVQIPEKALRKWNKFMNMDKVSMYQTLSEKFMYDFREELDWPFISQSQAMSIDFIKAMDRYIDFEDLQKNNRISQVVKAQFLNRI